jgi:hypothetical protein
MSEPRSTLVGLCLLAACSSPAPRVHTPPRVSSQDAPGSVAAVSSDMSSTPGASSAAAPEMSPAAAATGPTPKSPAPVPSDLPSAPGATQRSPPTAPLELAFVGDIILGKYKLSGYAPLFADGEDPFAAVAALLRADAAIANLETPLMHTRPERSPIYIGSRFGADKAAARALVGNFAALGLANNHALDLLTDGLKQSPEVLRELGLVPVGAAQADGDPVRVATLERAGWRVALIAAATWLNRSPEPGDPAIPIYRTGELPRRLAPALAAARADHDLVIVLLHWGQEYSDGPDHAQRVAARRLLDGGADLVIGSHPHVLHGLERHDRGLVAYSLGNFLFANTDERSRRSGVLRVRWSPGRRCPERASFHPVWLGEAPGFTPAPVTGAQALEIRKRMQALSKKLRTKLATDGDALVLSGWDCEPVPEDR